MKRSLLGLFEWIQNKPFFSLFVCLSLILGSIAGIGTSRTKSRALILPIVDQNTSCGPVSLAVASHWLNSPKMIEHFTRLAKAQETGISSLHDLKSAANQSNMTAESVRLVPRRSIPWRLPMILHLHHNHYVAALPIDGDHLVLADPPQSPIIVNRNTILGDWNGVALEIGSSLSEVDENPSHAGIMRNKH